MKKTLEKHTLLEALRTSTDLYGEHLFVSFIESNRITYREFGKKVEEVSNFLQNEGIVAGDRVAILSENQPHWGVAYFAITTMGAVAVPIMTEFSENQVHHILRHSESKAIFVSEKFYYKVQETNFEDLNKFILLDDFSIIPSDIDKDKITEMMSEGKKEFAKIKAAALKFVGVISEEPRENDLALLVYTSGTTGHSKGVMLTHKNIISNAIASINLIDVRPGDKMLSMLPLAHTLEATLGLVVPFLVGVSVYYIDKPPTAAVLLPALKKIKPTIMVSVPLVIDKIYRLKVLPEFQKKKLVKALYKIPTVRKKLHGVAGKKLAETFGGELKMYCIGGAHLPADTERFLKEAKFPYAIGYGLTETSPLSSGTNNFEVKFGAAGRPLEGVEIKIDNPDSNTGEGEVLIKGPHVMRGYYKDTEETKKILTKDGWFRSGDLGYLDKDNYLFLKGRLKNVIIGANGKNIYPEEIESIFNESPYVMESLVYESEGQLYARIHLNYDLIDGEFELQKKSDSDARKVTESILAELHKEVNAKAPTFSRINKIIEQPDQFEKTPTHKIKRYLYV